MISTIALVFLGCALGYPVEQCLDAKSIQRGADLPLYMSWGSVVAGVHGLVICWVRRRSAVIVARTAAVAMLATPIVAVSVTHLIQNARARRGSCQDSVTELDHDLAMRADSALTPSPAGGDRVTATTGD